MPNLKTTYLGLSLPNPIVVASSGLTKTLKGIEKCAAAGAGAVVLKSLFEERIAGETGLLKKYAEYAGHGEAADYLESYGMALGPKDYLTLVSEAKQAINIPVIASLNCFSHKNWGDYALKLEKAGADALELNVALLANQPNHDAPAVEEAYYRILQEVKSRVTIPVAIKIGPYFSSLAHFAEHLTRDRVEAPDFMVGWCGPGRSDRRIVWSGANGLVLFNRFYQIDIDIEQLCLRAGNAYSSSAESHEAMRWIALLYGRVDCDLAASTGIHDGKDVIKMLLAGASAVQVCSTLYRNGLGRIAEMLDRLDKWMESHRFERLEQFRGLLSQARSERPEYFERLQYVKQLGG